MKKMKRIWSYLLMVLMVAGVAVGMALLYQGVTPLNAYLIPFTVGFIVASVLLYTYRKLSFDYTTPMLFWAITSGFPDRMHYFYPPLHSFWSFFWGLLLALIYGVFVVYFLSLFLYYTIKVRLVGFLLLAVPLIGIAMRQYSFYPQLIGVAGGIAMGLVLPKDSADSPKISPRNNYWIDPMYWFSCITMLILALIYSIGHCQSIWNALQGSLLTLLAVSPITRDLHLRHLQRARAIEG